MSRRETNGTKNIVSSRQSVKSSNLGRAESTQRKKDLNNSDPRIVNPYQIDQVNEIWQRILQFVPASYRSIQLGLVFTSIPDYKTYQGAYATLSTINIGTSALQKCRDTKDIAMLLGHELGHHVLGHILLGMNRQITPAEEQDADLFSLYICEMAGIDRPTFIERFEDSQQAGHYDESQKHIQEHGTAQDRISRLKRQDQYLNHVTNF
ncbi:MAG: hypothetical protein Sylvanvirus9_14 [Sylvanvirus sp.]|uniref:Peptidase M48 domain-containing protein n=1 Tax=Sylvanvirus sp. TaxID=2487774 RepID=A0A3G5AJE8_9VIRU|nr:MAG: hypothetical protein Sylvanvirus9_14 [Sylvanvirus sp.]